MNLVQTLLKIENKYSWTLIGVVLTLIFGGFTLYTMYFQDKNPNLEFQLEAKSKVLDIREDVQQLKIFYKDEDLNKSSKNLSLFRLKIINNSSVHILGTFYDKNTPLGFFILDGQILETPELVQASNIYLQRNFIPIVDSTGFIRFPELIIEENEYIILDFLVLHKNDKTPSITTSGKIAGMHEIKVIESWKNIPEISFWEGVFSGNLITHLTRFVFYIFVVPIGVLIGGLIILFPIGVVVTYFTEKKRKKVIRDYKLNREVPGNIINDIVFDLYIEDGLESLELLQGQIFQLGIDPHRIFDFKNYKFKKPEQNSTRNKLPEETDHISEKELYKPLTKLIQESIVAVSIEDEYFEVNEELLVRIDDFTSYLKIL